jgi:hypothetical protein
LRWTRAASAREVRAGRVVPVSPKPRADERRCQVRLANISMATCTMPSNPVAQAYGAYGKTVWSWPSLLRSSLSRRCGRAQPGEAHRQFAGRGRPEGQSAPGGARHKPSNHRAGKAECWPHMYAAVRFFLRYIFAQRTAGARSAPGLPCALSVLRGTSPGKTRAKRAART